METSYLDRWPQWSSLVYNDDYDCDNCDLNYDDCDSSIMFDV